MKKEIVDNETGNYTMAQFLNEALRANHGPVSIAVGYFNVEGFACVKDSLWEATNRNDFSLRLLIGREAIYKNETTPSIESSDLAETSLISELDNLSIDERSARLVDDLIKFLKLDKVQVKKNPDRFTHAKCYIFDDSVVVGSSNFTKAGLATNIELNAVLYQPSAQQQVREWFDRRWKDAEDAKSELIQILEDSKFGLPLEPYTMYMKFLYEYYKPRLEELERERGKIVELTTFQQDAVNTALRIIRKYNGVLIADSTGLGKTHIGLELLREFVAVKRKKAIVIAPAQVLATVWESKLLEESIKTRNITLESTGTASFHPEDFLDYDLVVIDESQNYRNPSTNRYNNIMKLLAGGKRKKVILITATPVNNTLMDLYHQLSLITAGDDAHFADLGIPDLRRHFITADRKQLAQGIEDIVRILDEIMIRRTRQFIKENYAEATIEGKPIRFPERKLKKVEYSLTELFGGAVYKQVLDTIDQLNLVPYRVEYYRLTIEEKERLEAEQRATLQKIGLLKRFESSVEAIKKSVKRLVDFYQYFEKALDQDKILDSKSFHRILHEMGGLEVENDEELFQKLSRVPLLQLTPEYNKSAMKKDLEEDIKLLESLKQNLDRILPFADRKLTVLKELLVKDKVFETGGRKAVIFTQFVDTARYLYQELKEDLKHCEVRLLTGETDPKTRERIIKEFAPKANKATYIEKEADLLISTDVLSEGQNLQDANYVVNYDLPWNPMKIVQRVGRVDRLGSDYDTVTAAVFLPEKQLEDILGLLEKLETKIQKAAQTVGIEATILGEKENPKNFNAIARIRKEDQTLMDELERGAELLPTQTPFQSILSYLKKAGAKSLEAIPLGKRSGKQSDINGVVMFYREKGNIEGMHIVLYNYNTSTFDHYNDVAWIFRKIQCGEDELLKLPITSYEGFRQFRNIDAKAREQILKAVNAPFDIRGAQSIKPKNQRELANKILNAYLDGKISKEDALPIYKILNSENLVAWEDEFADYLDEYRRNQNIKALLMSLEQLFQKYRIEPRERGRPKALTPDDLQIVCYMFLSQQQTKDLTLEV
ncbi:MAG: helicase-related protein [Thermoproteota archaeon]